MADEKSFEILVVDVQRDRADVQIQVRDEHGDPVEGYQVSWPAGDWQEGDSGVFVDLMPVKTN